MTNFQEFYSALKSQHSSGAILKIKGEEKRIKSMIRLTSKNYLSENNEYIKVIFNDGSFLLALKNEGVLYYADNIVKIIKEIPDSAIGIDKKLMYNGKEYYLVNKDDYQFVLQLLIGSPMDIEGECRFSDYFPADGSKEFLSLGWLTCTGERADINPKFIENTDVEICS